jgi:DNA-binding IclR family transcriptional regulator
VFGAYMPAKKVELFVNESTHPKAFPHIVGALSSWKDLQIELQAVREHGMSRVVGKPIPGVSAFAAPVFDNNGHIALVITIIGPTGGFDPDWGCANANALREVSNSISAQLGFAAPIS